VESLLDAVGDLKPAVAKTLAAATAVMVQGGGGGGGGVGGGGGAAAAESSKAKAGDDAMMHTALPDDDVGDGSSKAKAKDAALVAALTDVAGLILQVDGFRREFKTLFEWHDGALVTAMKQGHHILLDEVSLAGTSFVLYSSSASSIPLPSGCPICI
jgi:hypothetical protein